MAGSRQDMERVTVTVADRALGVWDTFSGGEADSDDTQHRPGGMGEQESLGGPKTRGNFTISRNYRLERDHPIAKWLDSQAGIGRVVAVRQYLNPDKTPAGEPVTYTGTLKSVTPPDHDSNSSDAAMLSIEVTADGPIS